MRATIRTPRLSSESATSASAARPNRWRASDIPTPTVGGSPAHRARKMCQVGGARLTFGAPRAIRWHVASACARQRPHVRSCRDRGAGGSGRGGCRERRPTELLAGRASGSGGQGIARTGAFGARQLGLQVPDAPDHGQPGARRPAQGRAQLRPGDCSGAPGRVGPARARAAVPDRARRRTGAGWLDQARARHPGDGGSRAEAGCGSDRGPGVERAGGCPRRQSRGSCRLPGSSNSRYWAPKRNRRLPGVRIGARTVPCPRRQTSPTSGDSHTSGTPSRWRLPAVTAC